MLIKKLLFNLSFECLLWCKNAQARNSYLNSNSTYLPKRHLIICFYDL